MATKKPAAAKSRAKGSKKTPPGKKAPGKKAAPKKKKKKKKKATAMRAGTKSRRKRALPHPPSGMSKRLASSAHRTMLERLAREFSADLKSLDGVPGASALVVREAMGHSKLVASGLPRDRVAAEAARIRAEFGERLERLHHELLEEGHYLFLLHDGYGFSPDLLVVLPTTDPYDAIAAIGTSAPNYDLTTDDIIDWLRALENDNPFVLTGIGRDFLAGRFQRSVSDPSALAERIYQFCPDIVDQGVETVEALAEHLAHNAKLFLWWD